MNSIAERHSAEGRGCFVLHINALSQKYLERYHLRIDDVLINFVVFIIIASWCDVTHQFRGECMIFNR